MSSLEHIVLYTAYDLGRDSYELEGGTRVCFDGYATYSVGGKITTQYGKASVNNETFMLSLKSAKGFNNDLDLCSKALEDWNRLKFSGNPSSSASFFRAMYERMRRRGDFFAHCTYSANMQFDGKLTGGWIEAKKEGFHIGKIYHYDINQAYLNAALRGLPSRVFPLYSSACSSGYIVIGKIRNAKKRPDIPKFLREREIVAVTSEELDTYGLQVFDVERGVSFDDMEVNISPILFELAGQIDPKVFKRCTQSFWGVFAGTDGVDVEYYSGDERKLWNRRRNSAWATLITRRVAMDVWRAMRDYGGIACYIDSILCENEMPTGTDTGDWKKVEEYTYGVYIKTAGLWCGIRENKTIPKDFSKWTKHSGYSDGRTKKKGRSFSS